MSTSRRMLQTPMNGWSLHKSLNQLKITVPSGPELSNVFRNSLANQRITASMFREFKWQNHSQPAFEQYNLLKAPIAVTSQNWNNVCLQSTHSQLRHWSWEYEQFSTVTLTDGFRKHDQHQWTTILQSYQLSNAQNSYRLCDDVESDVTCNTAVFIAMETFSNQ